ncbi:MAG TPA: glycosyltransferase family 2 protein [Gaiellaceae bacterium]
MGSLDVVVVAYNSRDTVRGCVEPLAGEEDVTVIAVDNASPDDSLAAVDDLPVMAVRLPSNGGFAHGCNAGWRLGVGRYVLFLNPDARIDTVSLRRLAQVLDDEPGVGIVGPRIVDEHGMLNLSIRRFPRLSSTYGQALFLHRIWPRAAWTDEVVREPERYDTSGPAEWLSGACLLVRRSLLEQLDGLDDGFFMYCEDKDLCRRTWKSGYAVQFEPGGQAVHLGGGGASSPRGQLLPVLAASRIRYARKHSGRTSALAERLGIALSSLTHALIGRGDGSVRRGHAQAFVASITGT